MMCVLRSPSIWKVIMDMRICKWIREGLVTNLVVLCLKVSTAWRRSENEWKESNKYTWIPQQVTCLCNKEYAFINILHLCLGAQNQTPSSTRQFSSQTTTKLTVKTWALHQHTTNSTFEHTDLTATCYKPSVLHVCSFSTHTEGT